MEEKIHILKELEAISPTLKSSKEQDIIIGPNKDYFDKMQDQVMAQIKLGIYENRVSMDDVPENYFENLPNVVLSKVNNNEGKIVKLFPYKKWIGIAASLIFVTVAITFLIQNNNSGKEQLANAIEDRKTKEELQNFSNEDLNYIINNYSSEEDFEILKTTDLNKNELHIETMPEANPSELIISDEDLEYLNEIM